MMSSELESRQNKKSERVEIRLQMMKKAIILLLLDELFKIE